jgi:beta-lactamase class A
MADLLVAVREGRLLAPRETATALAIMREQQFDEGLPAYLPADVRCASKTGSLDGVRHDIALLERGDAWVAVAALGTDFMDGTIDRGTSVYPTYAVIGEAVATLLP